METSDSTLPAARDLSRENECFEGDSIRSICSEEEFLRAEQRISNEIELSSLYSMDYSMTSSAQYQDETSDAPENEVQALEDVSSEVKVETLGTDIPVDQVESLNGESEIKTPNVRFETPAVEMEPAKTTAVKRKTSFRFLKLFRSAPKSETPESIWAEGSGLEDCLVGEKGYFQVFTRDAGQGTLSVRVMGPTGSSRVVKWKGAKRAVSGKYNRKVAGKYTVKIKWDNKHIKGSPFKIKARKHSAIEIEAPADQVEMPNGEIDTPDVEVETPTIEFETPTVEVEICVESSAAGEEEGMRTRSGGIIKKTNANFLVQEPTWYF